MRSRGGETVCILPPCRTTNTLTTGFRYVVALLYSIVVALFWIPAFLARQLVHILRGVGTESWPRADAAAIQVYAILILLLALLLPPRYTRGRDFAAVVGFYVLAKIFEEADRQIFALGHVVSGHTLKPPSRSGSRLLDSAHADK